MQVQNAATIVGNVCNASPAADGVPVLLALDATVELASAAGRRSLPIQEFIVGNRTTLRRPDELVTGISIPKPGPGRQHVRQAGCAQYLVISIVSAAILIEPAAGEVLDARVAVGSCAPVARRLPALEAALRGRPLDGTLAEAPGRAGAVRCALAHR